MRKKLLLALCIQQLYGCTIVGCLSTLIGRGVWLYAPLKQAYNFFKYEDDIKKELKKVPQGQVYDFLAQECLHVTQKPISFYLDESKHPVQHAPCTQNQLLYSYKTSIIISKPFFDMMEYLLEGPIMNDEDLRSFEWAQLLVRHAALHLHHEDRKQSLLLSCCLSAVGLVGMEAIKREYGTVTALSMLAGFFYMRQALQEKFHTWQEKRCAQELTTMRALDAHTTQKGS